MPVSARYCSLFCKAGGGRERSRTPVKLGSAASAHLLVLDRRKLNDPIYVGTNTQNDNVLDLPALLRKPLVVRANVVLISLPRCIRRALCVSLVDLAP